MLKFLLAIVLIVLIVAGFSALLKKETGKFRVKKRFLTEEEAEECKEIAKVLSRSYLVFPKVRVLDVVVPTVYNDLQSLGKISSKRIDCLVTDKSYRPVAVLSKDKSVIDVCTEAGLVAVESKDKLIAVLRS